MADRVKPPAKRSFNEAAHKIPYPDAALREGGDGAGDHGQRGDERYSPSDVVPHAGLAVLALGALGVVYGDIGTSPLYAEQVTFSFKAARHIELAGVYGVVSLIFWSLMIVVSIKYAGIIMRTHNRGDGGIMALAALCRRHKVARATLLVTLGIFGASLFFGDGMITPAISVLSAVSGLEVTEPGVTHLIVPISVAILIALFMIQSKGTGMVGWLFGPVMLLWFGTIAVVGLHQVRRASRACSKRCRRVTGPSSSPTTAFEAFLTLGGVVLAVTGAEALYADRGHFGPTPIRAAWFLIVLPGVLLNYLGQAAWILAHPDSTAGKHIDHFNPFFSIVPGWGQVPMVLLATAATIIASQAVISGSYTVARQAMQLGYLPRLAIAPHLEARGPDLRARDQLVPVHRRGRAGARVQELERPRQRVWGRGDGHVHPQHGAVLLRRAGDCGRRTTGGWRWSARSSWWSRSRSSRRTSPRSSTAHGCRSRPGSSCRS